MKPIFKQEKEFLERKLGIELPNDCWINGRKIYLNMDKKTKILEFDVVRDSLIIISNNIDDVLSKFNNYTFEDEIRRNEDTLDWLEELSINKVIEYVYEIEDKYSINLEEEQLRCGFSSGKDSILTLHILNKALSSINKGFTVDFFNTSNDTAQTYRMVKSMADSYNMYIHSPITGFYKWATSVKSYFVPTVTVRSCCSTFKELPLLKVLDKESVYIIFTGVRKHESGKRSYLDYDVNEAAIEDGKKLNIPEWWHRMAPIVDWKTEFVWLYILKNNLQINPMYKMGFGRVGCLICPYCSEYTLMLIREYYPHLWSRWVEILKINHANFKVERRLKWTLDEYILDSRWKSGLSKESEIIRKGFNKENVQALADLKGLTCDVAEKFFIRKCNKCGGSVNPTDIALSYKFFGVDTTKVICEKCFKEKFDLDENGYKDLLDTMYSIDCVLF